ncbi:MAG: cell wall surface anchor family protein [Elusimicrobia bacterium]|nr:MAG: cell wall surface anchor family protein [Elusimicrobiota bacterium]
MVLGAGGLRDELSARSTTTVILSGFIPNSRSGVAVQAVNETAVSALSAAATAYSLALAPTALSIAQVSTAAVLVTWGAGTNSAGTIFEAHSSTDGTTFAPAGTTSATLFSVAPLESGATYFVRVRAANADGLVTAFSNTVSTRTPLALPTAPGTPTGVALTTGDVRWAWSASTGATSYQLVLATQTSSVLATPATSIVVLTGFAPNSLSSVVVLGVNVDGVGAPSGAAAVYTLAVPPASLTFVSVGSGTAALTWDAAGNAPGTLFRTEASTDGTVYVEGSSVTTPALTLSGLLPSSTYYVRVWTQNGDGVQTPFSNVASTFTLPPLPAAPGTPVGAALSVGAVSWSWAASSYSASYEVLLASKTSELLAATTATAATLSGFTPNQASAIVVRGVNITGSGPLSAAATRYTLADAPSALDLVALTSAAATLSWNGGANPAGTVFSLESALSPGAFSVAGTTTGTGLTVAGLAASSLYEFRVNAVNGDANPTAYSNGYSTQTLPAAPGTPGAPVGTAVGVSSVQWTWAAAVDAATYRVYTASSPADVIGEVGSASYLQTGLSPNTTAALLTAAVNATGLGVQSASSTPVYTLANPPSGTAAAAVYATSVTVSWGLNGNPAGTSAELQRSTDGADYSVLSLATTTSRADTGLLVCTSYYFRARNLSGGGVYSGFDAALSLLTSASTPSAPGSLQAAPAAGNRVVLGWDPSPSESVTQYRVYWDAGTGTVSYAAPLAVVPSSVAAFTTGVLTSSAAYRFALRAFNRCGLEDANTSVLASAPSVNALSGVSAAVTAPQAGKRVKGDSLTLSAAMTVGTAGGTSRVVFQYRVSTGAQWVDIATDTAEPYFVNWSADALGLAVDQSFDLRAVASDLSGTPDAAPSAVTITVVPANSTSFDVSESLVGGKVQRSQSLDNAVANTLVTGGGAGGVLTRLQVPAGALTDPNVVVTVLNAPTIFPPVPPGVESISVVTQVTLGNGQTTFAGGKTAALTLGYPDENGDGIVDGTTVRVDRLRMYSAATVAGPWVQDFGSSVDATNRGVTGNTPHFSFFALFVGAATDLASLRIYPVPFMPNNGDVDDGVPYSAGNANSGIVFDNLPATATVEVFTVTGQRVAKFTMASAAGRAQWDVKNDRGQDVASGGYVAVVSSPGVPPVIKKLLVVR